MTQLFSLEERVYLYDKNITMKLILLTIGLLALGVAGIAIKIWAKKDGEFAGTCALSLIHI